MPDCGHAAALTILLPAVEGDPEAAQALEVLRAKLATGSKSFAPGGVGPQSEAEAETMDLDEEAIDSLANLITGEALGNEDTEQRNVRLEASKARLKAVRRDVASQLVGVRKRLKR